MVKSFAFFVLLGLSVAEHADEFTSTLYKEVLNKNKDNFLFTPFSAEVAISLAAAGCKGETALEIQRALHILPHDSIIKTQKGNDSYNAYAADKLYIQENFTIKDNFSKIATDLYHAEIENIDFTKTKQVADEINKWVQNSTQNKITDSISSNDLNNSTRLSLVNALYFKGDWAKRFKLASTRKAVFYKRAKKAVEVDMMHRKGHFDYYDSSQLDARIIKIPFKGKDAYMVFVLPREKYGLDDVEKQIEEVFVPQNFSKRRISVAIPKFKIQTELDFKPILEKLGVHKAFDAKKADLSGISGNPGDLIIDKVRHKSFIDVSEEGVEAAASTSVIIDSPKSGDYGYPYEEFIADHPFIFFLRVKGFILFVGRVTSPNY